MVQAYFFNFSGFICYIFDWLKCFELILKVDCLNIVENGEFEAMCWAVYPTFHAIKVPIVSVEVGLILIVNYSIEMIQKYDLNLKNRNIRF